MNSEKQHEDLLIEYRKKGFFYASVVALVFLTPFSVVELLWGNLEIGGGSFLLVFILGLNAYLIHKKGVYSIIISWIVVLLAAAMIYRLFMQMGVVGLLWAYPAMMGAYVILPEKNAWLANFVILVVVIFMSLIHLEVGVSIRGIATFLATSMLAASFVAFIRRQEDKLQHLSITDPMTGLFSRVNLFDSLKHATAQANRSHVQVSLLTIEVDEYEQKREEHGLEAGELIIKKVGTFLNKRIRNSDIGFRVGGAEFLVLLYGTPPTNAKILAEDLREGIEGIHVSSGLKVTVSISISGIEKGETVEDWIKRAKAILIKAKLAGGNTCLFH